MSKSIITGMSIVMSKSIAMGRAALVTVMTPTTAIITAAVAVAVKRESHGFLGKKSSYI